MEPKVMVHLGVGSTPLPMFDKEKAKKLADLAIRSVDAGYHALQTCTDRPALKAVEMAVNVLEGSGITNSGIGAVQQSDGVQRCDASIMYGPTLSCGAVSSLERVKYPVSVARRLLDFSEMADPEEKNDFRWNFYFCGYHVEKVFNIHGSAIPDDWRMDGKPSLVPFNEGDTVGAVAIDGDGNLAAATSTGGTRGSFPGRIGDTPVIGAGTYANARCAVSNTGRGENVIKLGGAKLVCDLAKEKSSNAMLAVDGMMKEYAIMFPRTKATLGTIAIDHEGNWTSQFTGTTMTWAVKGDSFGYLGQVPGQKEQL